MTLAHGLPLGAYARDDETFAGSHFPTFLPKSSKCHTNHEYYKILGEM